MSLVNLFTLDLDVKDNNYISGPEVTSNDTVKFVVNVTDDGLPFDLTSMTLVSIGHTRPDGVVVLKEGTKTGINQVSFDLGTTEISVKGRVDAKVQMYDADGRVSTLAFAYTVSGDPSGGDFVPSENERTLIEQVLIDGPEILADAELATANAIAATTNVNAAKDAANTAATNANTAANAANTAKANADTATTNANAARDAANTAATNANTARDAANTAKANADTATANAIAATSDATDATNDAIAATSTINTTNTSVQNAESIRVASENTRINSEALREQNEDSRQLAEDERVANETSRQTNETTRIESEDDRISAELTRVNNETTRQANEGTRQSQETARQTNTTNAINSINAVRDSYSFDSGGYDPSQQYFVNNQVQYNGSTYICILNSLGNLPTNTTYWRVFASKGLDGEGSVTGLVSTDGSVTIGGTIQEPDLSVPVLTGDVTTHHHSSDRNRANHTGTQAASTIVQDVNNRFVTDVEKADWNAKETPEGSQAKVDTAAATINTRIDDIESDIGDMTTVPTISKVIAGAITELSQADATINTQIDEIESDIGDMATVPTSSKVIAGAITELFQSVSDGKVTLASAIADMGQLADGSMTFAQLAAKVRDISKDATAVDADVLATKTFYRSGAKGTGRIIHRSASNGTLNGNARWHLAKGTAYSSGHFLMRPTPQTGTDREAYDIDTWIGVAEPNLTAANIREGATILGVAGTFSDTTIGAAAGDILTGHDAFVNGVKVSGTMPSYGAAHATDGLTISGTEIRLSVPSPGYYSDAAYIYTSDPDFIAANILSGKNIFGLAGTLVKGTLVAKGATASAVVDSSYAVTVTGLAFRPNFIFIFEGTGGGVVGFYSAASYFSGVSTVEAMRISTSDTVYWDDTTKWTVNPTSFEWIPTQAGPITYRWIAVA